VSSAEQPSVPARRSSRFFDPIVSPPQPATSSTRSTVDVELSKSIHERSASVVSDSVGSDSADRKDEKDVEHLIASAPGPPMHVINLVDTPDPSIEQASRPTSEEDLDLNKNYLAYPSSTRGSPELQPVGLPDPNIGKQAAEHGLSNNEVTTYKESVRNVPTIPTSQFYATSSKAGGKGKQNAASHSHRSSPSVDNQTEDSIIVVDGEQEDHLR